MNAVQKTVVLAALTGCATNTMRVLPPHLMAQNCEGEFGTTAPPAAVPLHYDVQITLQPEPDALVGFPLEHHVVLNAESTEWLHYASTTPGCLDEWRGSVPSTWDSLEPVSLTLADVWVPEDGQDVAVTVGALLDPVDFPTLGEHLDEELQTLKLEVWMSSWHDSYYRFWGTTANSSNPFPLGDGPAVMVLATP